MLLLLLLAAFTTDASWKKSKKIPKNKETNGKTSNEIQTLSSKTNLSEIENEILQKRDSFLRAVNAKNEQMDEIAQNFWKEPIIPARLHEPVQKLVYEPGFDPIIDSAQKLVQEPMIDPVQKLDIESDHEPIVDPISDRMALWQSMKVCLPKVINRNILSYIFDNKMVKLLPSRLTMDSYAHSLVSNLNSERIQSVFVPDPSTPWGLQQQLPFALFPVLLFFEGKPLEIKGFDTYMKLRVKYETPNSDKTYKFYTAYIDLWCGSLSQEGEVVLKPTPYNFGHSRIHKTKRVMFGFTGNSYDLHVDQKMLDKAVWGPTKKILVESKY